MVDIEVGWRRQTSSEVRPWLFDLTPEMDSGDVVGATSATLTDMAANTAFPDGLAGAATPSGNTVTQAISGLVPGHYYRLVLTSSMGGSKLTAVALNIACPF